jgi:hypothetical protein
MKKNSLIPSIGAICLMLVGIGVIAFAVSGLFTYGTAALGFEGIFGAIMLIIAGLILTILAVWWIGLIVFKRYS